ARSARPSIFPLLLDDEEDALNLGNVFQNPIQGSLDHLLARLNAAPAVWTDAFNSFVQPYCQIERIVARRLPILCGRLGGNVRPTGGYHFPEVVIEGAASGSI